MRTWNYALNGYYQTASITVEETPAWIYFIHWAVSWICFGLGYLNWIRFGFLNIFKVYDFDEGKYVGFAEYYGDTMADWFHFGICLPVFNLYIKHTKHGSIEVDWYKLKKATCPRDKWRWDKEIKSGTKMRQEYGEPDPKNAANWTKPERWDTNANGS